MKIEYDTWKVFLDSDGEYLAEDCTGGMYVLYPLPMEERDKARVLGGARFIGGFVEKTVGGNSA